MKDFQFFCYHCQMENPITANPINHTFPVLIYPLLQSCFHIMHDSTQEEFTRYEREMKRNNPEEFHKEFYILARMFFQYADFIDDFEVWVEESDQILDLHEYKDYLSNFDAAGQEQIMYSWGTIEKELYFAFIDRETPISEDKNSKYKFTKELFNDKK